MLNERYLLSLLYVAVKLALNISYKLKVGTQTDDLSNCITYDDVRISFNVYHFNHFRNSIAQRKKITKKMPLIEMSFFNLVCLPWEKSMVTNA